MCHFTASLYTVLSAAMQSKGSAAFTGRWESGVCVYLDNSNIFIEAQRLATTRNGNSVDQSVRRRIRVDFDNLMELCCANRKLVSALAAVCTFRNEAASNLWRRTVIWNITSLFSGCGTQIRGHGQKICACKATGRSF